MMPDTYKAMTDQTKPLHPFLKLHVYNWLMQLRDTGEVNMFGVRDDLQHEWSITEQQATELLSMFHSGELEKHYQEYYPQKES
jgi:hypothetical protein